MKICSEGYMLTRMVDHVQAGREHVGVDFYFDDV